MGTLFWGGCCVPPATVALLMMRADLGTDLGFWTAAATGAVMFTTMSLYDLVILDWLVVAAIQPRLLTLPGTEGMPEYRDLRFHAVAALKGSPLIPIVGLLTGAIAAALEALG
ncbi:hypothetical protein [Nonomuraea rhizosphaerae]|uniref:hypothetical protein n=1 Tax=Nonomuraea rhizosphaerae TaxID=2665663 RepID=UPI001C5DDD65|nr:hypothetical protein [Nonomuraea rhizosphaerae]